MEPQSEDTYVYEKSLNEYLDVLIPYEVAYCPYNGTYQEKINKAYENDDKIMMKALIKYREDMIKRDNKIKELFT